MSKSKTQTMYIVFYGVRSIVDYEFVPQGQTMRAVFYKAVLESLRAEQGPSQPEVPRHGGRRCSRSPLSTVTDCHGSVSDPGLKDF